MKQLQQPPDQHSRNDVRVVDKEASKDASYWEEKVADAMRRISQRPAA